MALQTLHSTPTPSSTGSAPDPSNSNSEATPPGNFTLSGSPPLILAFLGVGAFVVAMIVFFGWRRMTMGRIDRHGVPPNSRPRPGFGETPKLWDVWSPREQSRGADTGEWKHLQPLAATVWDETPLPVVLDNNDNPHNDPLSVAVLAHLRRRYRRPGPEENIPMDAKLAQESRPLIRLQIAVTIAMPSPDSASASSRTEPDEQLPDYSLGLYEAPWKKTDSSG
ncbi:hypothetical protein B0H11DRAFT_10712 [Mycena galericulata]|nr:hypothetical protein B0H11DRAFT_10712 [Mycena galericulata]